jgi:hypothetical protein
MTMTNFLCDNYIKITKLINGESFGSKGKSYIIINELNVWYIKEEHAIRYEEICCEKSRMLMC